MTDKENFLPFALPDVGEAEVEAVADAIRSGWLTTGPNAALFEKEFAEFLGSGLHAVAVNSATAGLHLALEAVGIGPGDEVLVPAWTFTATAEVVRYLGGKPVLADVDPHTLNIDLSDAERRISERTKAIMPVHFAGLPVGNARIQQLAKKFGLAVIEDAAHAFPVREDGRFVGAGESTATVFSFYATKTITTGEGGMLVTRDEAIARRARTMRLHGISRDIFDRYTSSKPSWEYSVVAPGFKYNMTDTAAALGRVQLGRAEAMRASRMRIANAYDEAFEPYAVSLPARSEDPAGHAHHLYVLRLNSDTGLTRDDFIERMAIAGIGTSVHFIPLHLQQYWRSAYDLKEEDFPVASAEFRRVVSLPAFSSMTDAQVERVVQTVKRILSEAGTGTRKES